MGSGITRGKIINSDAFLNDGLSYTIVGDGVVGGTIEYPSWTACGVTSGSSLMISSSRFRILGFSDIGS